MMNERDQAVRMWQGEAAYWEKSHGAIIANLEDAIRRNPFDTEYHTRQMQGEIATYVRNFYPDESHLKAALPK